MKFMRYIVLLALVIGLFGAVQPVGAVAFQYTSGYQVQNLANAPANINITYYSVQSGTTGGDVVTTATDVIPALGSKTYFPIHVSTGFSGSVVISSDQPLASIVNLVAANNVGYASYIGASAGAGTMYLPLLMKNNSGYSTWYTLQNTGGTEATVNIAYSDGTTRGPVTIKPNASFVFDQSTENHTTAIFSAVVSSNQPVVAAVVQEGTRVQSVMATSGFAGGDVNALMPLINANNSGYITGVQIQNIGSAETSVTVSYTPVPGQGTACTETRTIPAKGSQTFALYAFAGVAQPGLTTNCVAGARFVGAAQISANTASQPLVATVNQLRGVIAGSYSSFSPAQSTARVVMPLIMDRNSGWFTGFNLQNVSGGNVTVNCTFTNNSYTISKQLANGEVLNDIQLGKLGAGYVGSGTCTATGTNAKVVAVVNEVGPGTTDILMVYEGLNVAP